MAFNITQHTPGEAEIYGYYVVSVYNNGSAYPSIDQQIKTPLNAPVFSWTKSYATTKNFDSIKIAFSNTSSKYNETGFRFEILRVEKKINQGSTPLPRSISENWKTLKVK